MKIGFLVNPIAGMGGSVALKGTDGEETRHRALELGASPMAGARAAEAVKLFAAHAAGCEFLAPAGAMGAEMLRAAGISPTVLFEAKEATAAVDTRRAAHLMAEAGVDLIVFAGGDGTARDICAEIDDAVPVVGIPAGVKIHSGVYAKKPQAAGMLVSNFLQGRVKRFVLAEVEDIDEEAFRENIVRARLYGYMRVPDDREFMQERKSGGGAGTAEEAANLATFLALSMDESTVYLIGSGSTTMQLTNKLGVNGTLLGVDAVKGGRQIGKDLTSQDITKLLAEAPREKRALIITVIGGQGHIFGRGNQQLSPDVLRMIPKENITVAASPSKMAQLFGKALIVDTGDPSLDAEFKGYIPVVTGHSRKMLFKVS